MYVLDAFIEILKTRAELFRIFLVATARSAIFSDKTWHIGLEQRELAPCCFITGEELEEKRALSESGKGAPT